ncbi:5325_t:CDS:2, partial [Funneliformis caledonium]
MSSSVAIGSEFVQKNVDILKAKNVQVQNVWEMKAFRGNGFSERFFTVSEIPNSGRGNKGINMRGRMHGEFFAGKCKAWKNNKIGSAVIREMIGALAAEPWLTIGVVVGLSKNSFTSGAVKAAEKSGIIITDSDHLYDDLSVVA